METEHFQPKETVVEWEVVADHHADEADAHTSKGLDEGASSSLSD